MSEKPKKFLDQIRDFMRMKHYSLRTEKSYIQWIKRYILFHCKRHPKEMGAPEIEAFLTHLATNLNVTASTQNQAFNALLFLYQEFLGIRLPDISSFRAKRKRNQPVVMTRQECAAIIGAMTGTWQLIAKLLYGCGMRVTECLRLRVKDADFGRNEITIREGKGDKDRKTVMQASLRSDLKSHLTWTKTL
ncbi:integron integrase [Desulfonema ishimotonii]|uniref:Integron integrase n=1 Tax=Desulfonema ishimotonii TaxID=45657 RepID=A0A401FXB2_9BACT|nr:phage integrase N-terminal SAM-like domain-containing protein [Desulfonema ishimotonii]GBC61589.1 integron integrase [Desulfonema ishimotonii]